ncbi:MAG: MGMT family protein [Candidatus Micrarchaeota archaeon]
MKPFSQRVLELCARVSRGKVTTYSEIAKALGKPKAARAVGNALNKNPFAPRIPCHRVVRGSGETGGYAGGRVEKEKLLLREGICVKNHRIPRKEFEAKTFRF